MHGGVPTGAAETPGPRGEGFTNVSVKQLVGCRKALPAEGALESAPSGTGERSSGPTACRLGLPVATHIWLPLSFPRGERALTPANGAC